MTEQQALKMHQRLTDVSLATPPHPIPKSGPPTPSDKKSFETDNERDKGDDRTEGEDRSPFPRHACGTANVPYQVLWQGSNESRNENQQPQKDAEEEQQHKQKGPKEQIERGFFRASEADLTENPIFQLI